MNDVYLKFNGKKNLLINNESKNRRKGYIKSIG